MLDRTGELGVSSLPKHPLCQRGVGTAGVLPRQAIPAGHVICRHMILTSFVHSMASNEYSEVLVAVILVKHQNDLCQISQDLLVSNLSTTLHPATSKLLLLSLGVRQADCAV